MAEPTSTGIAAFFTWDKVAMGTISVLLGLISIMAGAIGWNLRRQIDRVDRIEENYVRKDEFEKHRDAMAEVLEKLRDDVNGGHDRIAETLREGLRETNSRIDMVLMHGAKRGRE